MSDNTDLARKEPIVTDLSPYQQRRAAKASRRDAGEPQERGTRRKFDPDVAKARQLDRARREQEARRRAAIMLAAAHPEEWDELLTAEKRGVDDERGPLPGDLTPS